VIHPGWLNDLRVSRFLLDNKVILKISPGTALHHADLKSVAWTAARLAGEVPAGAQMTRKNRSASGLPTRPNATIRSPVVAATNHGRLTSNTAIKRTTH
jgi:hypothetical protein